MPIVVLALILGMCTAVNMRRSVVDMKVLNKTTGVPASSFSPAFLAAVDAHMNELLPGLDGTHRRNLTSFLTTKTVGTSGELMTLATRGAAELPPSVTEMLRQGHTAAAGANMWKANVDKKIVEKAIVNLNNMVFAAQIRLDAKNDECQEFHAKYTETLDQINSDLARLGQDMSNIARAISVHEGGISANALNNQKAKEELLSEELEYNNVRNADMIVLRERQTNMAVSSFILVFSACPDAPSAASLLQTVGASTNRLTSTGVQKCNCVNASSGTKLSFHDSKLDEAAQQLTTEAQDMLMHFIETEETKKGGSKIAKAASRLEAEALSTVEVMAEDLDDGDMDPAPEDVGDHADSEDGEDESSDSSMLQINKSSGAKKIPFGGPCGVELERVEIPDGKPCSTMSASCCSCNRYYRTGELVAGSPKLEGEEAWCSYVPSKRQCKSGRWLSKHPVEKAEQVCGLKKMEEPIMRTGRREVRAACGCYNAVYDCGVLHDMFAALWGGTKDLVDELTFKMNEDTKAWDRVKGDINTLLRVQATQLSNLQAALAEATAMHAAKMDEQAAKQKEKTDTTHLFDETLKECDDTMKEILYTEICGVLAVRNNMIAKHLPGEPTPTDCGVGEWVASDCSVSCDDELQGGMHLLAREVITMNSQRGVACPALHTSRKCKQIPCPIDCGVSHWSTWNKCSKECGGGVQSQTRSLEVKPKNGGMACDALMQTQPCNTGSCDADCELGKWMDFKPCTKACSAGYQERRKRVLSEATGDGTCLPWNDKERLERKLCNEQACTGDETCNSTMDLVIAIDASGSITEAGFDIMKEFAARIVKRLMAPVQVGVVLFGNGKLDFETNVISNAKVITDNLEGDMEGVVKKIDGMIIHKGFTNMAQAFTTSKSVLTYARKHAEAVVLLLTDGRPSFKFQTTAALKSLRQSARVMIAHVQASRKDDIVELLKGYASEPWSRNYRHIPGKKMLASAYESYVTSQLADLCPKLISPSALTECTDLTGEGKSEVYPCECGKALCKQDEICMGEDHYCIAEELSMIQGRRVGFLGSRGKNTTK